MAVNYYYYYYCYETGYHQVQKAQVSKFYSNKIQFACGGEMIDRNTQSTLAWH